MKKKLPPPLEAFLYSVASEGLGYALGNYYPTDEELRHIDKTHKEYVTLLRVVKSPYDLLEKMTEDLMGEHEIEM